MIYVIARYHVGRKKNIVVVPTTSLVEQMYKDFTDYGWDVEKYCHRVYSGRVKFTTTCNNINLAVYLQDG